MTEISISGFLAGLEEAGGALLDRLDGLDGDTHTERIVYTICVICLCLVIYAAGYKYGEMDAFYT